MAYTFILSIFCSPTFSFKNIEIYKKPKLISTGKSLGNDTIVAPIINSGIYKDISIAYDSISNCITGVYEYYDRWDEKHKEYSDINVFYFFGRVKDNGTADIKAAWTIGNQELYGSIVFNQEDDTNKITVFLDRQPNGYNDVDFTKKKGVPINLSKQKNWIQIRIIKLPKARFFDTPDSLRERKGYLIKNDVVKVLSKNTGGWYNIEYNPVNSSTKSTYGWLREEDFYDIDLLKWDNLKSNK